jgi:nucleoside 2-deoxyribosyltransferase
VKIYLATSWRNPHYDAVLATLRAAGHEVYDFRNEETAFGWEQIDPSYQHGDKWDVRQLTAAYDNPLTLQGFMRDAQALDWCDALVMLLPCGKSGHLELGYAAGRDKHTCVVMLEPSEPELMYRLCDTVVNSVTGLMIWLEDLA